MAEVGLLIVISKPNVINEKYAKFIRFCTTADLSMKYRTWIRISNFYAFAFFCILHVVGAFDARIQTSQLLSSLGVYSACYQLLLYLSSVKFVAIFDKYRPPLSHDDTVLQYLLLKYDWIKIVHLSIIIEVMVIVTGISVGDVPVDLFVPLHVIRHSGNFRWILEISNSYSNVFIFISTITMCSLQIYYCLCISAEFVLLQLFITRKLHVESNPNNVQQQKEVNKLLREFVECLLATKRVSKEYLKRAELFGIPLIMNGTLICSFIAYTLLTTPFTRNIVGLSFVGVMIVFIYLIIYSKMSQIIEDESSVLFELIYACPWYNWDIRNRKMLLIILPSVVSPTTISIFGLFYGNNTTILKFARVCYAMITFINKTK